MKNVWYKSNEAKQLYIGLAILFAWSLITGIYSYIKDIDWLSTMKMFWTTLNCNIGLGWLIIIFIIYSFVLKLYFSKTLNRNYLTKQEVNKRLSEKVNCSCCDESWDILFSQITPYHPLPMEVPSFPAHWKMRLPPMARSDSSATPVYARLWCIST